MKKLSGSLGVIIMCLCEILAGVLLLINPVKFTAGIIIGLGWVLIALGIVSAVSYFRTVPVQAAKEQKLVKGLCLMLLGAFCAFRSGWFIAAFPLLSMAYGVAMLLTGIIRVQWTVDSLRLKTGRWYWLALGAAVTLILAAAILANPFSTTVLMWNFVAVSLIIEAALDIMTLILNGDGAKSRRDN